MEDQEIVQQSASWPLKSSASKKPTSVRASATTSWRRKRELEVTLDQLWDVLRQRRAMRNAGQDPDARSARPPETVEGYLQ